VLPLPPLNVAESGSFDLNARIAFAGNVSDLGADVFTFSVTVGPDEKDVAVSSLLLDVFRNSLFVLVRFSICTRKA
jgi:hypothetical protein